MSTYGADIAALTKSVARLIALGPGQERLGDPRPFLAARDSIVGAIRGAYHAAAGPGPRNSRTADPAVHPVHALRAALSAMPRSEREMGPIEAVALCEREPLWAAATVVAVSLERHQDALRGLDGTAAWTAVGDLARLARALTHLDSDLAMRHPDQTSPAVTELTHAPIHARLRISADEVGRLFALGERDDYAAALHPVGKRPLLVRGPDQIPAGLGRLSDLLACTPHLAIRDLLACGHALQRLAGAAGDALAQGQSRSADDELAYALDRVRGPLAALLGHRRFLASTTPPGRGLTTQAQVLADAGAAIGIDQGRIVPDIAEGMAKATAALAEAIERTADGGGFLAPNDAAGKASTQSYLWTPARSQEHPRLAKLFTDVGAVRQCSVDLRAAAGVAWGQLLATDPRERLARTVSAAVRDLNRVLREREVSDIVGRRPGRPGERPGAVATALALSESGAGMPRSCPPVEARDH